MRSTLALALLLAVAPAASAHHTGTPPAVRFTTTGDNSLPRVPAFGGYLSFVLDTGAPNPVVTLNIWKHPETLTTLAHLGTSADPAASSKPIVAWDSDGDPLNSGDPGTQIFMSVKGVVSQVTHDASGSSSNPTVSSAANRLAFESSGNLAGSAPPGSRHIYVRNNDGTFAQISRGAGISTNPAFDRVGKRLVFESTSDPIDGHDTGIAQIWFALVGGTAQAVTAGFAPSGNPGMSSEGRVLVFESTADLAHGGGDTGIPQVFAYDVKSSSFAQITNDAAGCTGPSAKKILGDWRIAFTCEGQGYFYELRRDQRYRVQTPDGHVSHMTTQFGTYFLGISTTADLIAGGGTTVGHQLYLINLWKRPAERVFGLSTWFPFRGISALH
jgi:hypothetical protein